MPRVWLVTTGSYSDYRVHSVWATKELAQAFAARMDDANEVDDGDEVLEALPQAVSILTLSCGIYTPDATIANEREEVEDTWAGEDSRREVPAASDNLYVTRSYTADRGRGHYVRVRVYGTDHERVRKTYSEKKAFALSQFDVLVHAETLREERAVETFRSLDISFPTVGGGAGSLIPVYRP